MPPLRLDPDRVSYNVVVSAAQKALVNGLTVQLWGLMARMFQ